MLYQDHACFGSIGEQTARSSASDARCRSHLSGPVQMPKSA